MKLILLMRYFIEYQIIVLHTVHLYYTIAMYILYYLYLQKNSLIHPLIVLKGIMANEAAVHKVC